MDPTEAVENVLTGTAFLIPWAVVAAHAPQLLVPNLSAYAFVRFFARTLWAALVVAPILAYVATLPSLTASVWEDQEFEWVAASSALGTLLLIGVAIVSMTAGRMLARLAARAYVAAAAWMTRRGWLRRHGDDAPFHWSMLASALAAWLDEDVLQRPAVVGVEQIRPSLASAVARMAEADETTAQRHDAVLAEWLAADDDQPNHPLMLDAVERASLAARTGAIAYDEAVDDLERRWAFLRSDEPSAVGA
jgi:hypothetical protein